MSKIIISLCAFVMLAITPSVHADPIVISSGSSYSRGLSAGLPILLQGKTFL